MPKARANRMALRKLQPLTITWSRKAKFIARCDATFAHAVDNLRFTHPARRLSVRGSFSMSSSHTGAGFRHGLTLAELYMRTPRLGVYRSRPGPVLMPRAHSNADGEMGFVDRFGRFNHARFRNWNDEAPSGGTILRLLP